MPSPNQSRLFFTNTGKDMIFQMISGKLGFRLPFYLLHCSSSCIHLLHVLGISFKGCINFSNSYSVGRCEDAYQVLDEMLQGTVRLLWLHDNQVGSAEVTSTTLLANLLLSSVS